MAAAGKYLARNAGKFANILSDVGTISQASIAGYMVGTYAGEACLVGGATAGLAAPLVWLGCGTFFAGTLGVISWESMDVVKTVIKIH
jgi:hypothetical protein